MISTTNRSKMAHGIRMNLKRKLEPANGKSDRLCAGEPIDLVGFFGTRVWRLDSFAWDGAGSLEQLFCLQ